MDNSYKILTRVIVILTVVLMIFVVSILSYIVIKANGTKNTKENKNLQNFISKEIANDKTTVKLNNLTYEDSKLFIEYIINFKENSIESEFDKDTLLFDEDIIINSFNMQDFTTEIEKINNKEYKYYYTINLNEKDIVNKLNLIFQINAIMYADEEAEFTDESCFFIDANIENQNLKINDITVSNDYGELYEKYLSELYEKSDEKNPYYKENAPKIKIEDIEIDGIKLGIPAKDAINKLQNIYNKQNQEIDCSKYLTKEDDSFAIYSDDNIELNFYNDSENNFKVNTIDFKNVKLFFDKNKLKIDDYITQYYSEQTLKVLEKDTYIYKFLYGKEYAQDVIDGKNIEGSLAYILSQDNLGTDIDTNVLYYDNGLYFEIEYDYTTREITNIIISY